MALHPRAIRSYEEEFMSGKVSGLQSLTLLQKEILYKYFLRIFLKHSVHLLSRILLKQILSLQ